MDFLTLWKDSISIEWWKMLLMSFFFIVVNSVIFLAAWYMRRGFICEYGYPKRNRKTLSKKLASYSMMQQIFLICIVRNAERKGPYLWILLICHYICVTALMACYGGFVGCMITLADGWALALLTMSELAALLLTVVIEFIPDLIWLPSERKRYTLR